MNNVVINPLGKIRLYGISTAQSEGYRIGLLSDFNRVLAFAQLDAIYAVVQVPTSSSTQPNGLVSDPGRTMGDPRSF